MAQQTPRQLYPIGRQHFPDIRQEGHLYVDKTSLVYQMTHGSPKYFFLSRPRRFGKSLLVSTLEAYFQGRKELFEGLAISQLETEWTQYPVLRFSFATAKHMDVPGLRSEMNLKLMAYEKIYGHEEGEENPNQRLMGIVQRAHAQTGQQVVVLIDEYDAPLLDVINEERDMAALRNEMRNFYSPLKDLDPHLRFVFLTGITKFSQLSIFSELNNIDNISMDAAYAAICGFTEQEITANFAPGIERLAQQADVSSDEMTRRMKAMYDGYHFTWPSPDIYNPYSVLNALNKSTLGYYWFDTATPTSLIATVRAQGLSPQDLNGEDCSRFSFDVPVESTPSVIPLLYQSGYLTIKHYDPDMETYTQAMPNKEVRQGLMRCLLPSYVTPQLAPSGMCTANKLRWLIECGQVDEALSLLKAFVGSVPQCDNANSEGHYQSMLYTILLLVGFTDIDVEKRTRDGRIDLVFRARNGIYLLELKLNSTPKKALEQIEQKDYAARFATEGLPIVKIGLNFSTKTRTITGWRIA